MRLEIKIRLIRIMFHTLQAGTITANQQKHKHNCKDLHTKPISFKYFVTI